MKRSVFVLATLAVVGYAAAQATNNTRIYSTTPSLLGGNLNGGGFAINNVSSVLSGTTACPGDGVSFDYTAGVAGCTLTTDTAPRTLTDRPQANYPGGTQTAATLALGGGIDEHTIQIDNADTCNAGDTVGIIINGTTTTLTYGTDWCVSACTTQALRVTSLTAAIDALAGVSATESSIKVLVSPDLTTYSLGTFTESDAGCTTVSSGTQGDVLVDATKLYMANAAGPALLSVTAATSTPSILPRRSATGFGLGSDGSNVSVIVNSVGRYQFGNSGFTVDSTADFEPRGGISDSTADVQVEDNLQVQGIYYNSSIPTLTLAAAATTLAVTRNTTTIDCDAGTNTIATITGGKIGIFMFKFVDASCVITDDATASANTINISAAYISTANDTLSLLFDGTSWFEISRAVN